MATMTEIARGWQVMTGVGVESTPNTPVTPTIYFETQDVSGFEPAVDRQDLTGMHGERSVNILAQADGNIVLDPTFQTNVRHNTIGRFLYWAMGGGNNAAPTLAKALPSLTLLADFYTRKETISGCKLNELLIESTVNGPVVCTSKYFGMGYTDASGGDTTPSYVQIAGKPPLMHHGITMTVDSVEIKLASLSVNFNNNIDGDHYENSQTRTDVPEGERVIELGLTQDVRETNFITAGAWTKFISGGTASIAATYSDGTNSITFTFPTCVYTAVPLNSSARSTIKSDITARVGASGPNAADEMTISGL